MRFGPRPLVSGVTAVGLGLFFAASPASAACNPDTAIYADDFEFLDPSWGTNLPGESIFVEEGVLIMKQGFSVVNTSTRNQGAEVCVDETIAEAAAPDANPIGIVFWWQDWNNYYYLWYWATGHAEIRRLVNGQETTLFAQEVPALKQGVGQTNHLELLLKPKDATLSINGTQVTRFKGVQPKDGGLVGLTSASGSDKPATFEFDNFIVSPPTQ